MNIKFELEADLNEQITPITVANALVKCPQLDIYDIDELAMYLRVYADSRRVIRDSLLCGVRGE